MAKRLAGLTLMVVLGAWPSQGRAVNVTFPSTEVGTQKKVTEGSIQLQDGGSFKISEGESPRPVDRTSFSYSYFSQSHWTQRGTCTAISEPSRCPIEVNPVYPFQNNAPPFGVVTLTPVAFGTEINNLTLKRQQTIDNGPNFRTSQTASRWDLGQLNNDENYPLSYRFTGAEIVVGGPQVNAGPFQLNLGVGGLLGNVGVTKQTTSRTDNQDSNQSLNASGFAGGVRIEAVASAPGMPLFGSGILGARGTYTGLWGRARGGNVSRADSALTNFGLMRTEDDETRVDLSVNRFSGELLLTTLMNHLTIGVGGGWQQTVANTSIMRTGVIPGNIPVQREIRDVNRGTQGFGLISADLFIGNWCSCFAPLGARVEAQIGPANFGLFGKLSWMFGVNGRTLPQMLSDVFPANNPNR